MNASRPLPPTVAACAIALCLLVPAGVASAWTSDSGSGAAVAEFQNKKSGRKRLEKPNPTPLWSLYPLRQPESPEPTPQADTDALSTPPVKTTERPAEDAGAAPGAAQPAADEDEGAFASYLVPAALLAVIAAFGLWVVRRRRTHAPPARPAPAARRAPAPAPARSEATRSTVAAAKPSNGAGAVTASAPARVPVNGTAPAEAISGKKAATTPREPAKPVEPAKPPAGEAPQIAEPQTAEPQTAEPQTAEPQTAEPNPPSSPSAALPGAAEGSLHPSPGPTPATQPASGPPATGEGRPQDPPAAEPVVDREPVRVHLFDGRVIEGYKRGHYSRENRVLVLDVERVLDAGGREIPSTPLDSFLLPPQIDRIEALGRTERPSSATPPSRGALPTP